MTYNNLFNYLTTALELEHCDNTLTYSHAFALGYGIDWHALRTILQECGGFCDCEVLLNAQTMIPEEDVIGQETFKTPHQLAREQNLYCHCRVNGQPVDYQDALTAKA